MTLDLTYFSFGEQKVASKKNLCHVFFCVSWGVDEKSIEGGGSGVGVDLTREARKWRRAFFLGAKAQRQANQ